MQEHDIPQESKAVQGLCGQPGEAGVPEKDESNNIQTGTELERKWCFAGMGHGLESSLQGEDSLWLICQECSDFHPKKP